MHTAKTGSYMCIGYVNFVIEEDIVFPLKGRYDRVNKSLEGVPLVDDFLDGITSDGDDDDDPDDDGDRGRTVESATFAGADEPALGRVSGSLLDLLDRADHEYRRHVPGGETGEEYLDEGIFEGEADDLGRGGSAGSRRGRDHHQ